MAGNYKSSYLEEISSLDEPERDRYVDDAFYLDFSAKYYVTDQLQVNFDALNLTDEPAPFVDTPLGYDTKVHDPRGRVAYLRVEFAR